MSVGFVKVGRGVSIVVKSGFVVVGGLLGAVVCGVRAVSSSRAQP